jgi:hypothetical protein
VRRSHVTTPSEQVSQCLTYHCEPIAAITGQARSAWRPFTAEQPNQLWQADVTDWRLADNIEVEILNDHSRVALANLARPEEVHEPHDHVEPGLPAKARHVLHPMMVFRLYATPPRSCEGR